jgi:hypothetical protein
MIIIVLYRIEIFVFVVYDSVLNITFILRTHNNTSMFIYRENCIKSFP